MEPFLHNDPIDRKRRGITTIHAGGGYDSYLLMPLIPPR
jgi:hypothetical protein